ncbi:hypothetical protein KBC03_01820 [Patescibacteria group bacterium]|nr:hypothetical protein [Patescibacteria group bacterium]
MPHSLNIHKHDDKFKEIINGIEQDATILESFVMDENNKYSALLKSTQHSKLIGRSLFDCLSVDTDIAKVDVKKLLIENADKIDAIAFLEQYCAFAMHSSPEA